MSHPEQQYLSLMRDILLNGSRQKNRTGIDTFMLPGAMMKFDLQQGFPAVTTKKLFFNAVKGELLGFLRGYTSAEKFRELGCKIWDQNANENEKWISSRYRAGQDDLGYIYSRLWTDMPHAGQGAEYDTSSFKAGVPWNQITNLIDTIRNDPTSRRMIVSAWHPEVFDQAALPPCHVLFQCLVDQQNNQLHMSMYQRSCDMFLGVPFNIASYALLLSMIAGVTGYEPGTLTWFGSDCHVYENHIEPVMEQLSREPLPLPKLFLNLDALDPNGYVGNLHPDDIQLIEYRHHPSIKAPMAV